MKILHFSAIQLTRSQNSKDLTEKKLGQALTVHIVSSQEA